MTESLPFIPYPPIERHGVIGDRRTAALVAADGTIDWLCLPDYDGPSVFGALLDAERGGFWRLGPVDPTLGVQRYVGECAALQTVWETDDFTVVLTDVMLAPEAERPAGSEGRRTIVRRLRCDRGTVSCLSLVQPRPDFDPEVTIRLVAGGIAFDAGELHLGLWSSQHGTRRARLAARRRIQPQSTAGREQSGPAGSPGGTASGCPLERSIRRMVPCPSSAPKVGPAI